MNEIISKYKLDPDRKKVVLVNPSQYSSVLIKKTYSQLIPPISSLTVSTYLENLGFESSACR